MFGNFKACLAATLIEEGGYSNSKHDPGGATMKGIIQRVYDAWRSLRGLPTRDVRQITDVELEAIYRTQYWNPVHGDDLPVGLDLSVWDGGVNSGPGRSIKWLQGALGNMPVDGGYGQITAAGVAALKTRDAVIVTIKGVNSRRQSFVEALTNFIYFGKGWTARITRIEAKSLAMVMTSAEIIAEQKKAETNVTATKRQTGTGGVVTAGAATQADWGALIGNPVFWVGVAAVGIVAVFMVYRGSMQSARAKALASAAVDVAKQPRLVAG